MLAFVVVVGFVLLGIFGRFVAPHDPNTGDLSNALQAPSASYLFGTDELGRDVFSRIIDGSGIAVTVALVSVAIALIVGGLIGVVAGYVGGWVDSVLNRSQDIIFAFPTLLLAIILVAVLGPGLMNATLAIGVVYVPRFARLARSAVLTIKSSEFLDAARLAGVSTPTIMAKHIIPNVLPSLLVLAALSMSNAQLAYATLSFLGLGVAPPQADWGSMLSQARNFITAAPGMTIFPILALVLLILAFNVLGDAVRDVLDPRDHTADSPSGAAV
jgi:ABC-type dipeptide/oligopeptide/nickel transport system permease subunit